MKCENCGADLIIDKISNTANCPYCNSSVIIDKNNENNEDYLSNTLKRAYMFLGDGDKQAANEYFEKALDIDAECSDAYIGKLLIYTGNKKFEDLASSKVFFSQHPNYIKALQFADAQTKELLLRYAETSENAIKQKIEPKIKAFKKIIKIARWFLIAGFIAFVAVPLLIPFFRIHSKNIVSVSCGPNSVYLLDKNGCVHAAGDNHSGLCETGSWTDITDVFALGTVTVGLRSDGTVVAVGNIYNPPDNYDYLNLSDNDALYDIENWKNIVAVDASNYHIAGLRSDGTVVAVGNNKYGQCNTKYWTDIVQVQCGTYHTVGLRSDGTVVAVGRNDSGQCDVKNWENITAVGADIFYTVGLRSDGTVVDEGSVGERLGTYRWENIAAVYSGTSNTVGLRSNGTVVAVGDNDFSQCDTSGWRNITDIGIGSTHIAGLRSDGTVVIAGLYGKSDTERWTDIVAIAASGYYTVGLRSDGKVMVAGKSIFYYRWWE